MQTALKRVAEPITQFEITTNLLRNLYKYDLTPVTKLVLLELTTHLNEVKNGSVVFPSIGYIAEVLGIGLTAAKKAINDLIKKGLIIKSKRSVSGNHNKYVLTQKVTVEQSENELFKQSDSDLLYIRTNNKEQIEQQRNSGENVYTGDDLILYEYAKKKAKYSVDAFIKKIKENGGDKSIIKEYNKKNRIATSAMTAILETQKQIQVYKDYEKDAVTPESCIAWGDLGKKLGIKK